MKKRTLVTAAAAVAVTAALCLTGSAADSTSTAINASTTEIGSNAAPNLQVGPFPSTTGSSPIYSPGDAGYLLTPGSGITGFKYVAATFVVPSISSCSTQNSAVHIVGLGGWGSDTTLAAIGVGEGCSSGTSSAYYYGYWFDNFVAGGIPYYTEEFVPNWFIAGGDTIFASVQANPGTGNYTYTLNNITSGATFTTTYTCGGTTGIACASASAEVFTVTFQNNGPVPANDFGTVTFNGAKVTPIGSSGTEGLNNSAWTTTKVIDYGTSTSDVVVQPGSISGDSSSSSFTNTWENGS